MDEDEKGVLEYEVDGIDGVFIEAGATGYIKILFTTKREHELAVRLPPLVVSMLEAKLKQVNEHLAAGQLPQ